jgi:valyl-tRNA synthetase
MAAAAGVSLTWDDLADWYLEAAKFEETEGKKSILKYILKTILKMWHPFIPFVTEKIWREMGEGSLLMAETWPKPAREVSDEETKFLDDFEIVKSVIIAIRNARSENKVEPSRKVKAVIYAGKCVELVRSQAVLIKSLRTGVEELEIEEKGKKPDNAIYASAGGMEIYLLGAVDEKKEKERIKKEITKLQGLIAGLEKKLANEEFVTKAPEAVVAKEREKLDLWKTDLAKMKKGIGGK